ncbi:protein peste [Drosophila innubila]|uniref:protein peste n=1 Tax=Drosophila innubila TaxID=198719 RepID=UPI00148DB18A|nr:protein peste [Drosophila innubila]XP_034472922.1 protein peste [Drosophila innubila]
MPTQNSALWRRRSNRGLFIGIFGLCLGLFGILCGMFWEDIFNWIKHKEMVLAPDTQVYENWKTPPIELHLDIYMYNWTNPEEFGNLSSKPILQQLGPYRFIDKPDKVDIVWHPENSSVTYRRRSMYYFDAAGSAGSLDDEVTTLNAVTLSAAATAKQWSSIKRGIVDTGLKIYDREISVTKTVDEMLFTGYSDTMIDAARAFPVFGDDVKVPFDKFGWFYTRNGSADLTGVFNVYTGADDLTKLGQMHSWNYQTHTGFFESFCGLTNGSAGEFQPPQLQPGGSVGLFTPDMCRTLRLDYEETVEIEGVQGYKFTGGARSVDNGTLYPENLCFCGGKCAPSGVMNVTACRFDSPVFMSYPHFYNADQYYLDQVEGLQPNKEDHEFYMVVEPRTGIPLEVAARFQVNMLVEPIDGIALYTDVPRIFFPLIWFEQKVRITPELADQLKMLPLVLLAGQIFSGLCLAIGLILLCWTPAQHLLSSCRNRHYDVKSNGQFKSRSQFSSAEELKSKASTLVCEKNAGISIDSSPLLVPNSKHVMVMPKSQTRDSVATASTVISEKTDSKKD